MRRLRKACQSAVVEGFVDEGRQREALASSRDEGVNLTEGFVAEPQSLLGNMTRSLYQKRNETERLLLRRWKGDHRAFSPLA